jgi:hypothetical protein
MPADAVTGTYQTDVEGWNVYNDSKTLDSGFTVNDISAVFNVSDDNLDIEYNWTGNVTHNITITNKMDSEREVEWTANGDLENFTSVNWNSTLNLSADETRELRLNFDVDDVVDYNGEIILMSSGYNKTIDVELDAPNCEYRNASVCVQNIDEWINITEDSVGYETEMMNLIYIGDQGGSSFIRISSSGDISPYVSVDPSAFTLTDSREVMLNYSVTSKGNYTGTISVSTSSGEVSIPTKLVANIDQVNVGISGPASLDFGTVTEGESATVTASIENTGQLEVTDLTASSSTYNVEVVSPTTIGIGSTSSVEMNISNIASGFGDVTLTGSTSQSQVSTTISISGTVEQAVNYEQRITEIEDRISSLSNQASSPSTQTQLQNLELEVANLETLYQNGNTQQANQRYNQMTTQLDTIEQQIDSGSNGGTGTDGQTPDNNDTFTGGPDDENSTGGGGGGFLIIGVVLLVILIVGFVFYTSYVPEEGDPLYDLLGDK